MQSDTLSTLNIIARITLFIFVFNLFTAFLPVRATAFTVGEEKEVGEELLSVVRQHFEVLDDPDISSYINNLGQSILKVAGSHYFDYHFFVIKNKEFNAFAAPSGLIFIHTGLLEAMDNEGELVSVMAHEVGHVTSRHISDRIKKQKKASIGTAAMMIAGLLIGGGAVTQALMTGSMAAGTSMNLKFSRENEEESDRLAFKWMQQLHLDPAPQATMLQKMHKASIFHSANIPPYLLTHPEPKRRKGYVEDLIIMNGPQEYPPRDDFAFLRIKKRVLSKTKTPQELKAISFRLLKKDLSPVENIMARYALSLAYYEDADYARARKEMQQVVDFYPEKPILKVDLAAIMLHTGEEQQALTFLRKAWETMPDSNYAAFLLGQAYQQQGNNEQAIDIYDRLLTTLTDYAQLHYNLGGLLINVPATKGKGHYHLARYFWLIGNRKSAKYHFQEAVADPSTDLETKEKIAVFRKDIEKMKK